MYISKHEYTTECPNCRHELTADTRVFWSWVDDDDAPRKDYIGCEFCLREDYADKLFILSEEPEEDDDSDYKTQEWLNERH